VLTGWAVGGLAAGTYLLRLSGLLLRGRITVPDRVARLLDLAATALIAGVVVTGALAEGAGFAGWARPAGVAVGALAAWLRLPLVAVVLLAAAVTAGLRLLGVP
jgi:branched-subunit amino acid transport protein